MKLFKNALKVLHARAFNTTKPLFVHLNVTNKCNMNCLYCYNRNNNAKDLSFANIKKIIDTLSENGTLKLTIIGGEPLLRDDIGKIVYYAKGKIPYVFMTTNGIKFKCKRYISELNSISFSINNAYENDYINLLFRNILSAKKCNPRTTISCVLNRSGMQNLKNILNFSRKNSIGVYFTPLIGSHSARFESSVKIIINAKKKGYPVLNSFQYLSNILKPEKNPKCFAGKLFFFVNTDGGLSQCLGSSGDCRYNILGKDFDFKDVKFSSKCKECFWNCHMELNYLLLFRPSAILNLLKSGYV